MYGETLHIMIEHLTQLHLVHRLVVEPLLLLRQVFLLLLRDGVSEGEVALIFNDGFQLAVELTIQQVVQLVVVDGGQGAWCVVDLHFVGVLDCHYGAYLRDYTISE